jgi:hypothetical protein
MGFNFSQDGEVTYVPEDIKAAFQDEITALQREAREARETAEVEDVLREVDQPAATDAEEPEPVLAAVKVQPQVADQVEEEEEPLTQMAAAFAALKMEQLTSDTPPEETKA